MLINLTNHPKSLWSGEQLRQAAALAGEVIDMPFPYVPADADSEDVVALGQALVTRINDLSPTAVLVQGEYTLAYYMVSALADAGIRCLCATSDRHKSQGPAAETYQFIRFRDYTRPRSQP